MRAAVETTRILRRSGYAGVPLHRMMADVAAASTVADTPVVDSLLWKGVANVDASRCIDPLVRESDLRVMQDVITEEEELIVAEECMKILKRRRYEEDHWDQVIVKFKEMERSRWSTELTKKHAIAFVWLRIETKRILDRLREVPILPQGLEYFPAVHVIDLAEDGYIKPHVDSIKFSGRVVAGVSLLSPSIMRFKEEHGESIIDAFLPRRSFYVMTGRVRYHYTHEILPGVQVFRNEFPVNRTRRISIMLRDEFQKEHLEAHDISRSQTKK